MQMVHDYLFSALKKRFATSDIKDVAGDKIEVRWPDGASVTLELTNLLELLNAEPAARQEDLDSFLTLAASGYEQASEVHLLSAEEVGRSTVAIVRNQSYLDEMLANVDNNPPEGPAPLWWHPTRFVSRKLPGDLVIILMLDRPTTLSPLDGNEPMALIFGDEELFRIALANMRERARRARFESMGGGLTRVLLDDETFNSSVLAVDSFWWKLQQQRGGDAIVVAAPTRADVVFGSADQSDQVDALRRIARMSPAPYPLSRHLYKYDNGSWSQLAD